jgi:hypothetical protein
MLGRAVLECLILRFKCSNPAALATVTKCQRREEEKLVNKSWCFFQECIEYYGARRGQEICKDYYDDFIECSSGNKQVRPKVNKLGLDQGPLL